MAHRPSSIDRLPPELRELIGRLRDSGRTIDEILAKLRELDVAVSRTALARHTKEIDAIATEIRRSRGVAEAIVAQFGEAPESRAARLNIELMQGLVMRTLVGKDGESVVLSPREVQFLADALHRLARAAKDDVERELKLREKLRQQVGGKLEAIAADVERDPKLAMPEVLKRIRQDVYGVFE